MFFSLFFWCSTCAHRFLVIFLLFAFAIVTVAALLLQKYCIVVDYFSMNGVLFIVISCLLPLVTVNYHFHNTTLHSIIAIVLTQNFSRQLIPFAHLARPLATCWWKMFKVANWITKWMNEWWWRTDEQNNKIPETACTTAPSFTTKPKRTSCHSTNHTT